MDLPNGTIPASNSLYLIDRLTLRSIATYKDMLALFTSHMKPGNVAVVLQWYRISQSLCLFHFIIFHRFIVAASLWKHPWWCWRKTPPWGLFLPPTRPSMWIASLHPLLGEGEICVECVHLFYACVWMYVCFHTVCVCVFSIFGIQSMGIMVSVLIYMNVCTVPCLPPPILSNIHPSGIWGVHVENVVQPDNLFYLTGRGTPLSTTLAWWRFKLSEIEPCVPVPAINHLSNYNLHGSIGSKKEVYEAQACQAGGKCLHGSVFGARRGDLKEERSAVWFVLYFPVFCCDTPHFDPLTPVRFVLVDCALYLCACMCVFNRPIWQITINQSITNAIMCNWVAIFLTFKKLKTK